MRTKRNKITNSTIPYGKIANGTNANGTDGPHKINPSSHMAPKHQNITVKNMTVETIAAIATGTATTAAVVTAAVATVALGINTPMAPPPSIDEVHPKEIAPASIDEVHPKEMASSSIDEAHPKEMALPSIDEVHPKEMVLPSIDEVHPKEMAPSSIDEAHPTEIIVCREMGKKLEVDKRLERARVIRKRRAKNQISSFPDLSGPKLHTDAIIHTHTNTNLDQDSNATISRIHKPNTNVTNNAIIDTNIITAINGTNGKTIGPNTTTTTTAHIIEVSDSLSTSTVARSEKEKETPMHQNQSTVEVNGLKAEVVSTGTGNRRERRLRLKSQSNEVKSATPEVKVDAITSSQGLKLDDSNQGNTIKGNTIKALSLEDSSMDQANTTPTTTMRSRRVEMSKRAFIKSVRGPRIKRYTDKIESSGGSSGGTKQKGDDPVVKMSGKATVEVLPDDDRQRLFYRFEYKFLYASREDIILHYNMPQPLWNLSEVRMRTQGDLNRCDELRLTRDLRDYYCNLQSDKTDFVFSVLNVPWSASDRSYRPLVLTAKNDLIRCVFCHRQLDRFRTATG